MTMPASRTPPPPVQSFPCSARWQAPFSDVERAHTQATESVSGHSFGRFGGFPGEKTGTHDGRSMAFTCMGANSQIFDFHTRKQQSGHGEHDSARVSVQCVR